MRAERRFWYTLFTGLLSVALLAGCAQAEEQKEVEACRVGDDSRRGMVCDDGVWALKPRPAGMECHPEWPPYPDPDDGKTYYCQKNGHWSLEKPREEKPPEEKTIDKKSAHKLKIVETREECASESNCIRMVDYLLDGEWRSVPINGKTYRKLEKGQEWMCPKKITKPDIDECRDVTSR